MKIVAISDTHCKLEEIPQNIEGDLLLHAGDLTFRGQFRETEIELQKLAQLARNFDKTMLISGNHDFLGENNPQLMKSLCQEKELVYLDSTLESFKGFNVFGTPYTPQFGTWAFMRERGEKLAVKWEQIPEHTDILLTHGPPRGILDYVERGGNVGCDDLLKRLQVVRPKLVVFGHIHEAYGRLEQNGTIFINASICNKSYQMVNAPQIIEL